MGFGWPRKNPCNWIPHFCGMTHGTDAIDIAFMDGREKNGWARKEAEVIPQPMRKPKRIV